MKERKQLSFLFYLETERKSHKIEIKKCVEGLDFHQAKWAREKINKLKKSKIAVPYKLIREVATKI